MRMYAACLASYNNGCLHGEWLDLEDYSDKEELLEAIAEKVLRTSPYPNVAVECPECAGSGSIRVVRSGATDIQVRRLGLPQLVETRPCPCCGASGKVSSAEEWAAHDWDGEGLSGFGEYPDLDKVLDHVRLVSEHGEAWLAYVEHVGEHYATEEGFEDARMGECESPEDWAEEFLTETGALESIPENLRSYFDFKAYARDAQMGGDVSFVLFNGTTYVFSNH